MPHGLQKGFQLTHTYWHTLSIQNVSCCFIPKEAMNTLLLTNHGFLPSPRSLSISKDATETQLLTLYNSLCVCVCLSLSPSLSHSHTLRKHILPVKFLPTPPTLFARAARALAKPCMCPCSHQPPQLAYTICIIDSKRSPY